MREPGFEKDFRDKLKSRELEPAPDSWNRLRVQLDGQSTKRSPKIYWWMGVAAVVTIALVTSNLLLTDSEGSSVVFEEAPIEEIEPNQREPESRTKLEDSQIAFPSTEINSPVVSSSKEPEQPIGRKVLPVVVDKRDKTEFELAQTPQSGGRNDLEPLGSNDRDSIKGKDPLLLEKVDELIAEVQQLEQETGQVSDAEIEALLLLALQDLEERDLNRTEVVDAEDLLREVENELEDSFRKRVFQLVKQGFEATRTVVVNRLGN